MSNVYKCVLPYKNNIHCHNIQLYKTIDYVSYKHFVININNIFLPIISTTDDVQDGHGTDGHQYPDGRKYPDGRNYPAMDSF